MPRSKQTNIIIIIIIAIISVILNLKFSLIESLVNYNWLHGTTLLTEEVIRVLLNGKITDQERQKKRQDSFIHMYIHVELLKNLRKTSVMIICGPTEIRTS
jgi:hypothetical protein